jgi:hypothetical protein
LNSEKAAIQLALLDQLNACAPAAPLKATRVAITAVQNAGSQLLGKFGPIMQHGANSPEAAAAAALKKLAG